MKYLKTLFLMVLTIGVLVACSEKETETTFEGQIEGMDTTSVVTSKGDDMQNEVITYKLNYDDAFITNEDEAKEVVDMQRETLDQQFNDVPKEAVSYEVSANKDEEVIEMKITFDYSKQENIDALKNTGYIEGGEKGAKVSLEKTKEQYEKDGLKEKEN